MKAQITCWNFETAKLLWGKFTVVKELYAFPLDDLPVFLKGLLAFSQLCFKVTDRCFCWLTIFFQPGLKVTDCSSELLFFLGTVCRQLLLSSEYGKLVFFQFPDCLTVFDRFCFSFFLSIRFQYAQFIVHLSLPGNRTTIPITNFSGQSFNTYSCFSELFPQWLRCCFSRCQLLYLLR